MKAKDYVEKLKGKQDDMEVVSVVVLEMMDELVKIAKERKCEKHEAFVAVFREQWEKWKAISRLIPGLRFDAFEVGVKCCFPDSFLLLKRDQAFR